MELLSAIVGFGVPILIFIISIFAHSFKKIQ